ncbi:hypothetical protein P154DRAFT_582814 [Amniculicola lignicola CBS 123094]|uniref:Uncharacterized protein n=1 Tax=Amniculicola lignicola CBS 123094 TaxID=1392246 RepID=A0A6A5VUG1_9PLEO|nr:hypothetical protein P154DRAFT_582814 [Amniculicola lignicola CBS 123094]
MSPTKSPSKSKARSRSPTKSSSQPPYTPAQIKQVLQEALSPNPALSSPSISVSKHRNSESGYHSRNATTNGNIAPAEPLQQTNGSSALSESSSTDSSPYNDSLAFSPYTSPVRPLAFSSPRRMSDIQQTFEVQSSFLEAILMLLARQANIAPDLSAAKAEVKKIVRKELKKEKETKTGEVNEANATHHNITTSVIVATAAAFAGLSVYQRARILHPEEMAWYAYGAWKGGLCGLAVAMAVKWGLWAVERGK